MNRNTKTSTLPNLTNTFNARPIKIPTGLASFGEGTRQTDSKFIQKYRGPRIAKTVLKKCRMRGCTLPDTET